MGLAKMIKSVMEKRKTTLTVDLDKVRADIKRRWIALDRIEKKYRAQARLTAGSSTTDEHR